jgi:tetratricopeptide (TPR) repeat protein
MQTIQPLTTREGPRQALIRLVAEQPLDVWTDSRRLAALLRDYCPAAKREILAIQLAQQERLVEDLQRLQGQLPVPALIARLSGQLQERAGLTESMATWSLTSWACALGYLADDDLDPSNSETVVSAGSQTFPSSPAIITPTDPYRDILISARKLLDQATSVPNLEEAIAAGEQALRLVSESLKHAPSHAGLHALAVQARAETARLSQLLAQSALAAGSTTRATELWQRVLELAPQHHEARTGLKALQEEYTKGVQEAEELWKCSKLPAAIAQLERLQKRFPHLVELGRLLTDRRSALTEIQSIRSEILGLKQSGRLQRLLAVYDRLETLAPVPGLTESRQVLVNQLAQAEPTMAAARTALQSAQYDDAIRHAGFVLTRFVDHAAAQQLRSQAESARSELHANLQLMQTSIRTGDALAAEESYAKLSAAEQQLPKLLMPYASLRGLRARQTQRRQRQIAVGVGLILWLLAGWIAQLTTPSWSTILGQLPAAWPAQVSANWLAQVVQSLIAAFLIGTSAAFLRGKGEFISILWLLAATTAQLIVGAGWLYAVSTFPALDQLAWHVLMRGVLYGFWIVVAYGVLLGQSKRLWFSGAWGCLVGSGLILGCLSLPENMQSDARQLLLAVSLWMTALLVLGWIDRLRQFALVPFAFVLLALIVPSLSNLAWEPVRWLIAGSLLTLALLPLAAKRLLRWQIAVIVFMAILAAAGACQLSVFNSPPDLFALAMLWCWTWLPCLRTN